MRGYGQFCAVAKAAELFCERWTPLLIRDLAAGASQFSELQRGVPVMSPTLLSRRLKELVAEGVVERRPRRGARGWTYHLTPAGAELVPLVEALGVWSRRWSPRALEPQEVDLDLLLWTIERDADAQAFGHNPAVVRLELTDQPEGRARWWFLNQAGGCALMGHDPGHGPDLIMAATLRDLIHVVRGDLPLGRAVAGGRLALAGAAPARGALGRWLNRGPLARIPPERRIAGAGPGQGVSAANGRCTCATHPAS